MAKLRADQLLVDRGRVESGRRAQALILAGLDHAGERKTTKATKATTIVAFETTRSAR